MQKIKKENGITMIALIITMIVMMLISIPVIVNTVNISDVDTLAAHREDFYILAETISQVYEQDKSISEIGPQYTGNTSLCNNPNDNDIYYVINANKLSTDFEMKFGAKMKKLNFGSINYGSMNNVGTETGDIYIINAQSRTVYYLDGFDNSKGETIYTYPQNYTNIVVKNYDE